MTAAELFGIPNDMVGVLLFAVYVAVALVWRVAVHWRRSGDRRGRLTATTPLGRVAALVLVAAHLLVLAGLVGADAPAVAVIVGTLVVAGGLTLVVRAQVAMGDSWRVGVDPEEVTDLVTGDVFASVRNPIFTGMAVCLLGMAVASWSWVAVAGVVLFVLGVELQVRLVEEPYLARTHGAAFAAYRGRTGRFVPQRRHATS